MVALIGAAALSAAFAFGARPRRESLHAGDTEGKNRTSGVKPSVLTLLYDFRLGSAPVLV